MTTHTLTTTFEQARGVIGRYPDHGERYVFEFESEKPRSVHMLGVRRPLRVEWWADDELIQAKRLRPWLGWGRARCDRIVERRPE